MPTRACLLRALQSLVDDADGPLTARSDEELVALLRQGRHGAFEILATRYQTRLLHFCWKILRSKEDAEDALQDVLAAAFRALVADDREVQVRPTPVPARGARRGRLTRRVALPVEGIHRDVGHAAGSAT